MSQPIEPAPRTQWLKLGLLVVLAALVVIAIAVPNVRPMQPPRVWATGAIGKLKTIATSQSIFREGDKDENGKLDYGTLAQLSATQLVDVLLGTGTRYGYTFATAPSARTPELLWFAVASPIDPAPEPLYFCTNQEGKIFYTRSGPFALDTGACEIPSTALPVGR